MQVADEGNDLEFWNDADFFDRMQEEQDIRFLWSASGKVPLHINVCVCGIVSLRVYFVDVCVRECVCVCV